MSELGCYLKYDNSSSEYDECVFLEHVYDVWENGYSSETYIIQPSSVYYEKASFCGFTLDHLKTAKRIKQRKFKAVKDMMISCRQELDYLGMTGERIMSPEIQALSICEIYFLLNRKHVNSKQQLLWNVAVNRRLDSGRWFG